MNGDNLLAGIIAMMSAVVGLAIIAVLVGKNSQTSGVLQSFFSGYSSILSTAVSPVSGSTSSGS